jgi:hypothetical protein
MKSNSYNLYVIYIYYLINNIEININQYIYKMIHKKRINIFITINSLNINNIKLNNVS